VALRMTRTVDFYFADNQDYHRRCVEARLDHTGNVSRELKDLDVLVLRFLIAPSSRTQRI
jgi:hypothetical protein